MIVAGLILAGGEGSQLGGVRKADLRIGNMGLLNRVIERMRDAETPLLIATGPGPIPVVNGATCLADPDDIHRGPMAGLAAALHHLKTQKAQNTVLVSVAVDTPFLPADYVSRLLAPIRNGAPAAYAAWGQSFYPTSSAFLLDALTSLPALPDSPKALLRTLGGVSVDWSDSATHNPFANINTLSDLLSLSRRVLDAAK